MSPEYGSTIAIFPIDEQTLAYLRLTGRSAEQIALVEAYAKAQGLFRTDESPDPLFTDVVELDLSTVEPNLAGPRRPQDRVRAERREGGVRHARSKAGKPRATVPGGKSTRIRGRAARGRRRRRNGGRALAKKRSSPTARS